MAMTTYTTALQDLLGRVPRRHSIEHVKEINAILAEYESILQSIEGINAWYEKQTAALFDTTDTIRKTIKMSTDNKASKKNKDAFFDEASGLLKDDIQALITLYGDGSRTA
jgi:hypothetical protein